MVACSLEFKDLEGTSASQRVKLGDLEPRSPSQNEVRIAVADMLLGIDAIPGSHQFLLLLCQCLSAASGPRSSSEPPCVKIHGECAKKNKYKTEHLTSFDHFQLFPPESEPTRATTPSVLLCKFNGSESLQKWIETTVTTC